MRHKLIVLAKHMQKECDSADMNMMRKVWYDAEQESWAKLEEYGILQDMSKYVTKSSM